MGNAFKDLVFMTDSYEFGILIGADLLSSTGFKMNLLVK